jgi:hypothetical protein
MWTTKRENRQRVKGRNMSIVDWGQVIFLAIVVLAGVGGMIKVLFIDKKEKD